MLEANAKLEVEAKPFKLMLSRSRLWHNFDVFFKIKFIQSQQLVALHSGRMSVSGINGVRG